MITFDRHDSHMIKKIVLRIHAFIQNLGALGGF